MRGFNIVSTEKKVNFKPSPKERQSQQQDQQRNGERKIVVICWIVTGKIVCSYAGEWVV